MTVRPAGPRDADAIARLHHEGWRGAYRGLLPDAYLDSLDFGACLARWQAQLDAPGVTRQYVAERDGVVQGFVSIGPSADPDARAAGEIWDLWVDPGARSQGIGAALLDAGLGALAKGYPVAVVWVLAANTRGRAFYTRHGAEPTGTSRTQPVIGGEMSDVRLGFDIRGRQAREGNVCAGTCPGLGEEQ